MQKWGGDIQNRFSQIGTFAFQLIIGACPLYMKSACGEDTFLSQWFTGPNVELC